MRYNWQQEDWPDFRFRISAVEKHLMLFAERAGRLSGLLDGLSGPQTEEATLELMIAEAIKSSAIEGENLADEDVKSSIRNHLGLNWPRELVGDDRAEGIGELMVSVRETYQEELTAKQLFSWHRMLMKGAEEIRVGQWREGGDPMQVVSGRIGNPRVHFEAPPAKLVEAEMRRFLAWFNRAPLLESMTPLCSSPLRSGLAHLYFESIHPFEDGNGRLGRAISEKALSQGVGRPVLTSLSQTIEAHRKDYYRCLEMAQTSNEVTEWVVFFVEMVLLAQEDAETRIGLVVRKKHYFDHFEERFNDRQLKAVRRLFKAEPRGFEGGMSAKKYMALTGASKATATRDLRGLLEMEALMQEGGGRSTRYRLPRG